MFTKPAKFWSLPTQVEAMQFRGWENAAEIHKWCNKVFFVPTGAEHELRQENEKDHSRGSVLDRASSFLVLQDGDESLRIDVLSWIIKMNDKFIVNTDLSFKENFVANLKLLEKDNG